MKDFKTLTTRKLIIGAFLCVPMMTSFVSMIHLLDLFNLGNKPWISIILAIAFEMGSIASFLALGILEKLKRGIIWSIFALLAIMQMAGNIYATFYFINQKLIKDPKWLDAMQDLLSYFIYDNTLESAKLGLTLIIAIPISLISLAFLKSLIDYIPSDNTQLIEDKKPEINTEIIPVDNKEEELNKSSQIANNVLNKVILPVGQKPEIIEEGVSLDTLEDIPELEIKNIDN